MKTRFKMVSMACLAMLFFLVHGCSKDENEDIGAEPLIGTWQLFAISNGSETRDVTAEACYSRTRLDVNPATMRLTLSVPNPSDGTACQEQAQELNWLRREGTYFYVNNGQEQPSGIQLSSGNQQLQMEITVDGDPVQLLFRR